MTTQLLSEKPPLMSERRVSLIGAMLVAIGPLSMALYTPAMPELVHYFGVSEAAVKLTLSSYFGGFAFAQLVCGPLSDGFGRKPVTLAFLSLYLAASVLALFAPTIHVLIIARVFQGIGAAVGMAISRAIVRDLFTSERSARIMNLIALILAIAPALSPTLGGLTLKVAGWHAIFILMLAAAIGIMAVVHFYMVETVPRDLSRIRPLALLGSYRQVLSSPSFVLSSLVLAGSTGAIYTQATILSFILMTRVGLSAGEFGASMLMQSGMYFLGSLATRKLLTHYGAFHLVPFGFGFLLTGCAIMAVSLHWLTPSFLSVMGPVAFFSFGLAFILPAMTTAALASFPHAAGAAASMSGFFQMGGGLLGGLVCAWIGDPVAAMGTVIPCMGLIAALSWFTWTRLPKPPLEPEPEK